MLFPTSAFLNAHHLFSPSSSPPPFQQPSVCFLYLMVSYGLPPSVLILFSLPFPYVHLFCFLNFTYEWNHIMSFSDWLILLSVIHSYSSLLLQMARFHSFLSQSNTPLSMECVCVCVCVYIYIHIYVYVRMCIYCIDKILTI